jgi:lipopolysaccharide export system permease protein
MQFLWKYIDDLVGKGLEWNLIAELLFYASATFVPLALPLAILLSSLMTFGSLGEHYELVAMKTAGVSLHKIMRPLVILSIFISLSAFYFSNNILPIANLKFHSLYYSIRTKKLAFNIREGIFYTDLNGYVIRVGKKENDDITIHDILIYNHTSRLGNIDVTVAKSGRMEASNDGLSVIFTLFDGYSYKERTDISGYRKTRPFERTSFEEQYKVFDLSDFKLDRKDEDLFSDHYLMLNVNQLSHAIDSLNVKLDKSKKEFPTSYGSRDLLENVRKHPIFRSNISIKNNIKKNLILSVNKNTKNKVLDMAARTVKQKVSTLTNAIKEYKEKEKHIRRYVIVLHEKFTLSFACLILFFIGAPLGAIIRKGGLGLPVVFSVIFFIIYHIISITGKKYVDAGQLSPFIGMWISSAILLPVGAFLTYKATTDAPLLDKDAWIKKFQLICNLPKRFTNRS